MNIGPELAKGPILVGIDFSGMSQSVLEYAVRLALQESRHLHLSYVMPIIPTDPPEMLRVQEDELKAEASEAAKRLQPAGLTVDETVLMGSAAHELIQLAETLDAACIVVGTEGFSGFDRFLMGSVSEAVIRQSDRPVIVVGPEAAKRSATTIPWKHLLLACDTELGVTEAARLAGNIAVSHHARLTIFNVRPHGIEKLSESQFGQMEQMMSREAWLTLMPHCLVRTGDTAKEIIKMVDDAQADLLVMSVHSGGELLSHLRSGIMATVLRNSRCPAMVLRDAHPALPRVKASEMPTIAMF